MGSTADGSGASATAADRSIVTSITPEVQPLVAAQTEPGAWVKTTLQNEQRQEVSRLVLLLAARSRGGARERAADEV
jgi:uncharacterized protein YeaC (DUF1315 family)